MNVQRLIETHNTYEEPHNWSEQAKEALEQLQNALKKSETMLRQIQAEIDELKAYQKHDIELADAVGWEKGYEAGRQLGMKQERALWELAASTQEIERAHGIGE